MKRVYILLFVSMMLTSVMNAQEYGKFKLGLGGGFATGTSPSSSSEGQGGIFTLEPAYRASDNLAIGLRLEAAAYGAGHAGIPGGYGSITTIGQYYFSAEEIRPFVGVGLGSYLGSGEWAFGFYPRAGFDFGHFTVALEYNLIGSSTPSASGFSYLSLRIGVFFFGGKN